MVPVFLAAALGVLPASAGASAPAPTSTPARDTGPIRRVAIDEQAVALTFDACATKTQGYGFDRAIFDILKTEAIPATIFVSGRWVDAHPDAMEELTREPLIEFGDHSYDHPHMSEMTPALMAAQLDDAEAALARYGKHAVAFRPPFGEWNRRLLQVARDHQLPTVTWDVVSGDPSEGTTASWMIRSVVSRAKPGSIIVFHINGRGWKTAQALPEIVRGLRDRGFHFVPVSRLLASGPPVTVVASHAAPAPAAPAAPPAPPVVAPVVLAPPPAETTETETVVGHAPTRSIVTDNPYGPPDHVP